MKSLQQFAADLRRLPRVVAHRVATEAAPALTAEARRTFNEGETPYGVPWAPGKKGQKVTLRKSGDLERYVRYVAIGTRLRIALGVFYAKYQIGKRPVFPRQSTELPPSFVSILQRTAVRVVREELSR